jgi:deoxycytidylate deaminase
MASLGFPAIPHARPGWDQVIIGMLEKLVLRSQCLKVQTAACMVQKGNQIIAMGYNGTLPKHVECVDYWTKVHQEAREADEKIPEELSEWIQTEEWRVRHREWSLKAEVHAEANALKQVAQETAVACTLYTLKSPCRACVKDILSYGIKRVVYRDVAEGVECVKAEV